MTSVLNQHSKLKHLKLLDYQAQNHAINSLIQHLNIGTAVEAVCPNLSQLFIRKHQTNSPRLLAEILLSRRLAASLSITVPNQNLEGFYSFIGSTLFLHSTQIEKFREEEERVLERSPEWIRVTAGRAEVKDLEEWGDDS